MQNFNDAEVIKLLLLSGAFVIGVGVCAYVVVKDSLELSRRRQAKRLIYEAEVKRELRRAQEVRARIEEAKQNNFQSFA